MNQESEQKSFRFVWIAAASLVVFFVVLGIALLLVTQSDTNQNTATSENVSGSQIASKEEITSNISTLSGSIKQSVADQTAAKAALDDDKNQIKVGS